jgi:tetratricopeptide (TPR) repeat protein
MFNLLALFLVSACSSQTIKRTEKIIHSTEHTLAKQSYKDGKKSEGEGNNADALKSYEKSTSYDDQYKEAWEAKARVLNKLGRTTEAKEAEDKAKLVKDIQPADAKPAPTK